MLIVNISDDRLEIHEDKKGFLFQRGLKVESGEGNKGMYLSEVVLESHGWSIELVDDWSATGLTDTILSK